MTNTPTFTVIVVPKLESGDILSDAAFSVRVKKLTDRLIRMGGREIVLRSVWDFHPDGTEYINTELEARVAEVIRRYPNPAAPSWLAPVAAIRTVHDWMVEVSDD
jgi:hypothetical protein